MTNPMEPQTQLGRSSDFSQARGSFTKPHRRSKHRFDEPGQFLQKLLSKWYRAEALERGIEIEDGCPSTDLRHALFGVEV